MANELISGAKKPPKTAEDLSTDAIVGVFLSKITRSHLLPSFLQEFTSRGVGRGGAFLHWLWDLRILRSEIELQLDFIQKKRSTIDPTFSHLLCQLEDNET